MEALHSVQSKVGESLGTLFRKTMTDLVRGIRAAKDGEAKYISAAMQEVKEELSSQDKDDKANAVQKLTYVRHPPLFHSLSHVSLQFSLSLIMIFAYLLLPIYACA